MAFCYIFHTNSKQ